ncbi:Adenylate isopentenyltransferase 5, chloroplastic [Glycine soja]|nr:Adenylate isopentenyltransferase 5, chloroplastic [Glycine soja]
MMNMLSVSAALCKPVASFNPASHSLRNMNSLSLFMNKKEKVVVIMGATGTGKSKLAIELATQFPPAEIVNSDKMQVYEGLNITTNKVTEEERRGVPHHLLGTVNPNTSFTAQDFCDQATLAVGSILGRDGLPIIAGGSNSFLDALVNHHTEFRLRYDCCFLWVDVSLPVLHSSLSARVDRMIHSGQLHEVRQSFQYHNQDYTLGIRKAIGVPEFHDFFRAEADGADQRTKQRLLQAAIASLKTNNCTLAKRQLTAFIACGNGTCTASTPPRFSSRPLARRQRRPGRITSCPRPEGFSISSCMRTRMLFPQVNEFSKVTGLKN